MRKIFGLLIVCLVVTLVSTNLGSSVSKVNAQSFATETPTIEPSPSKEPTVEPTLTEEPTVAPTVTEEPTWEPGPTEEPTPEPTPPGEPIIEPIPTDSIGTKNSIPVCPLTIGYGKTIQCSIQKAGEIDKYSFIANAGDKILVRMSKSSGTLWPKIGVYNPSGVKVCEKSASTSAEISTCSLPVAGKYTIRASDGFNGKYLGNYYLYLQRLNNPGTTVSIAFGVTTSKSISTATEMDSFSFTASAGDKILVRMSNTSGSLWPSVRVYSPRGAKLCTNSAPTTAEIEYCALPVSGKYLILVSDGFNGTYIGGYNLYLQKTKNPINPVSITYGKTLTRSIIKPAQMVAYTFYAKSGDKVLVRMSKLSGGIWPGIRIYSPTGMKLCTQYASTTAEIATCSLTSTGKYTILAYDGLDGTHTGEYYIHLQRLNNPGLPVSIAFGQTLYGTIDTPAEMDPLTFTATAGDKVLVRMSKLSGGIWPGIRIYSPTGMKLCEQYASTTAEIASCSITTSGIHTILGYDGLDGTHTGEYYLYLQRLNNPGNANGINLGETLTGAIDTPAEMDTYIFSVSGSTSVLVRMTKSSSSDSIWPGIRVYSPLGVIRCEDYSSSTVEITSCSLPSAGTYTILAFDGLDGTHTGNYTIHLH